MVEREKIVDPQEIIRLEQQLPVAEKALKTVRKKISSFPSGLYIQNVWVGDIVEEREVDEEVVVMMLGGIQKMRGILNKAEGQFVEKQQDPDVQYP
jgi:hypothetical protein